VSKKGDTKLTITENMPGKGKFAELTKISANRVKKIMQTNEEVGKLAQPVPVMVARSLELFAKSLLLAAGKVAEQSGAKTLTPVHLKTAVEEDERLDFLKDKVEDVSRPGGDTLGKHRTGVKDPQDGADLNLASLMAHEDADTGGNTKKSQKGVKIDKEGKTSKKRPQPKLQYSRTSAESSSEDFKPTPEIGFSDPPFKRPKISKTESESVHLPKKVVLAKAQDLDEDYDNI